MQRTREQLSNNDRPASLIYGFAVRGHQRYFGSEVSPLPDDRRWNSLSGAFGTFIKWNARVNHVLPAVSRAPCTSI